MDLYKELYENCVLCPRNCGANRLSGEKGFCNMKAEAHLSCALLHRGEEPPVTGEGGSGTLFFSGCTLGCGFCQNYQISTGGAASPVSSRILAEIMISLQERGAENINLVTATHFIPPVAEAVFTARENGLEIPLLWNSSGYEKPETVELLSGFIDVFLPDVKTLSHILSERLFCVKDYPDYAVSSLLRMAELKKTDVSLTENGKTIREGVMVRHLLLPGEVESTGEFLKWFSENLKGKAILSLMFQYEPAGPQSFPLLPARNVSADEIARVYDYLDRYGIDDGFIQEPEEETEWLPDFENENPFPGGSGGMVWHWKKGFFS